MYGVPLHPVVGGATGLVGGITAKVKDIFTSDRKKTALYDDDDVVDTEFTEASPSEHIATIEAPKSYSDNLSNEILPTDDNIWLTNLESSMLPPEMAFKLISYKNKLGAIYKKYPQDLDKGLLESKDDILKSLVDLYIQGKLASYTWTNFFPVYKEYYSIGENFKDYSDLLLSEEMEGWVCELIKNDRLGSNKLRFVRNMGINAFEYGQLKGFQEQGIFNVKISNVFANDGLRYKINELLVKGMDLTSLISPKDEVAIFVPCIEGFDEFENNLDPHIERYRDIYSNDIKITNCPVEYIPFINRYLNKVGRYFKKKYSAIEFVKDIVDLGEWENTYKKKLEDEYKNIEDKQMKLLIISGTIVADKTKKRGAIPVFEYGKKLYISNWLGMEDISIMDNLIKHIDIYDDRFMSDVTKNFKKANYNLSSEEIETYKVFGYIEPISGDANNPHGYRISEKALTTKTGVDLKVLSGKVWNESGKCVYSDDRDVTQIFKDNLKVWIEYPHLLSKDLRESFNNLE
jgi:hypothetical protein